MKSRETNHDNSMRKRPNVYNPIAINTLSKYTLCEMKMECNIIHLANKMHINAGGGSYNNVSSQNIYVHICFLKHT